MARPALPKHEKKKSVHLTISNDHYQMMNEIRLAKNESISSVFENFIKKEYSKIKKQS